MNVYSQMIQHSLLDNLYLMVRVYSEILYPPEMKISSDMTDGYCKLTLKLSIYDTSLSVVWVFSAVSEMEHPVVSTSSHPPLPVML